MQVSVEGLKTRMQEKTDDDLRAILLGGLSQDYTPEAIRVAQEEFRWRSLSDTWVDGKIAVAEEERPYKRGCWNRYWPSMDTEAGALLATRGAFWAAVWVTTATTAFAVLAASGVRFVRSMGFDVWALTDAALFGVIAMGLWRKSRWAAWCGLLLYIAERLEAWSTGGIKNPVLAILLILAFIGACAAHPLCIG